MDLQETVTVLKDQFGTFLELCHPLKSIPITTLACFGLLAASYLIFIIYFYVYYDYLKQPVDLRKYGKWAIVTGSTSGLGYEFSIALAQQGVNLVLLGKSPKDFEQVAQQLQVYNIEYHTVNIDFSQPCEQEWDQLKRLLQSIDDLGVCINNAGIAYMSAYPTLFHDQVWQKCYDVLKVNQIAHNKVLYLVLQKMAAQRRGLLVNMSSASAYRISIPCVIPYGSTKKYILELSKGLAKEYKDYGITIQALTPTFIYTPLTVGMKILTKPNVFAPHQSTYVKFAMRYLGCRPAVTPYWPHSIQSTVYVRFPRTVRAISQLRIKRIQQKLDNSN